GERLSKLQREVCKLHRDGSTNNGFNISVDVSTLSTLCTRTRYDHESTLSIMSYYY
ncbi:hypothetical protein Pcinc_043562, partial [Petrolisthes cinctipes]